MMNELKPANEPIVVARKPISEKTVADNVLKWGTGGINIDDSRIEHNEPLKTTTRHGRSNASVMTDSSCGFDNTKDYIASANPSGRFPANVLLDEVSAELLDKQSGHLKSGTNCTRTKTGSFLEHGGLGKAGDIQITYGDDGGASRFFYCIALCKIYSILFRLIYCHLNRFMIVEMVLILDYNIGSGMRLING
jgi:site-specific DNA-methyltransferase (adenine-specific)